ncbi:MAG: hypothetical protein LBG96_12095 [Tannerella sp.]|jgi:hypothetical protein|nr:hypothetical protein [Tannerella sp.]
MKTLIRFFVLSSLAFLGASCSSDSESLDVNSDLQQSDIKLQIATYYSSPSSPTQPVNNIKAEFDKKFPGATDVEWKVSNGIYEIDFDVNHIDYEAWYNGDANLLMYKYDIANSQLSPAVLAAIATDYQGYILDETEIVYKGDIIGYYLDLKKNKEEVYAFYNENGTFIARNLWEDNTIKPGNDANTTTPTIEGNTSDDESDALIAAYYSGMDMDVLASNVPSGIIANFNTLFPNARDIDWDYVSNVYNVDFEIGGIDYEAWYVSDGTLLMYTQEIRYNTVSTAVQNAVSSKYSEYMIDEVSYFQKGTVKGYIIKLENKRTDAELKVIYNENGTFIYQQYD